MEREFFVSAWTKIVVKLLTKLDYVGSENYLSIDILLKR